jgi:hypothetical protein
MTAANRVDAEALDHALERAFAAPDAAGTVTRLREAFVNRLDFDPARGVIPLRGEGLPEQAERVAERDGVRVVAVALKEPGRVRAARVREALKEIQETLAGEALLLALDAGRTELHIIYPSIQGGRDVLRRMVMRKGQGKRTVCEQIARVYEDAGRGDLRAALERAFDVEAVTKKFFQEYRETFERVKGLVQGLANDEERKLFCQTLFNRLMFLAFLQRKG